MCNQGEIWKCSILGCLYHCRHLDMLVSLINSRDEIRKNVWSCLHITFQRQKAEKSRAVFSQSRAIPQAAGTNSCIWNSLHAVLYTPELPIVMQDVGCHIHYNSRNIISFYKEVNADTERSETDGWTAISRGWRRSQAQIRRNNPHGGTVPGQTARRMGSSSILTCVHPLCSMFKSQVQLIFSRVKGICVWKGAFLDHCFKEAWKLKHTTPQVSKKKGGIGIDVACCH